MVFLQNVQASLAELSDLQSLAVLTTSFKLEEHKN